MNNQQYHLELLTAFKNTDDREAQKNIQRFYAEAKNPTSAFGFSLFLGSFGVDRMVVGHVGLGILKLLTLGGLGIWTIIDWFLIASIVRKNNVDLAKRICA